MASITSITDVDPDGRLPILLIPFALKALDAALTAADLYTAAQTGGASAVGRVALESLAGNALPGAKIWGRLAHVVGDAGLAAKGAIQAIKAGAAGGETAGKNFSRAVREAAKGENPLNVCVYCRREGVATQVDHAIPKARGGNATLDNAQLACPHCNASKGARDFPVNPPPGYRGEWPPSHWGQ